MRHDLVNLDCCQAPLGASNPSGFSGQEKAKGTPVSLAGPACSLKTSVRNWPRGSGPGCPRPTCREEPGSGRGRGPGTQVSPKAPEPVSAGAGVLREACSVPGLEPAQQGQRCFCAS